MSEHDAISFDVAIIGAGPAGLAAAIRLKQLNADLNVCILEKGADIGTHILSGAVLEPRALFELIPDAIEKGAPLHTKAGSDHFLYLTKKHGFRLPTPPQMKNHGNYIVSMANLCRWLAEQATTLGVEIFPGFPAREAIIENGQVVGVRTQDAGIAMDGSHKPNYQPGIEIRAKFTLFGEGCRGSISENIMKEFNLRQDKDPQTYAIGIKEIWEIDPKKHKEGKVMHTIGWPLSRCTYGGSFVYHMENNQISLGLVVGLDYKNPYLNPFEELQRLKHHPKLRSLFEGAKRIGYGSRALNEGGFQSIPDLCFPGGALIGCSAGFMNVPKIKGNHTAMKSGMCAAEAVFEAINRNDNAPATYESIIKSSWLYDELYRVRNIRPGFHRGLWRGLCNAAVDTYLFRGKAPWTLKNRADHTQLKPAKKCKKITYPRPDGKISFDRLTSVQLSGTNHEEDQPKHLTLKDNSIPVDTNLHIYDGPETRYCPAGVYEYVKDENGKDALQINAQNCVHCKTCDIKDPCQNIKWVTPEGGGGPRYSNM